MRCEHAAVLGVAAVGEKLDCLVEEIRAVERAVVVDVPGCVCVCMCACACGVVCECCA
jgi:hypothetical protein